MTLREYLYKSYCKRNHLDENQDNDFTSKKLGNEFELLERRLSLVFGKKPNFLNAPDIEEHEKLLPLSGLTQDKVFFVKEHEKIFTPNERLQEIDTSIEKIEEDINEIIAIFWYIVILFINGNINENTAKHIKSGVNLIHKKSKDSFSNFTQQRKMFKKYFEQETKPLTTILEQIQAENAYNYFPDLSFFISKDIEKQDVLNYINSTDILIKLRRTIQNILDKLGESIDKKKKYRETIFFEGGLEDDAYDCEINQYEKDLFNLLITTFPENCQSTFNKIKNNDWSDIDIKTRENIIELIKNIYNEPDLKRINRYIVATLRNDLEEDLQSIETKLLSNIIHRFADKYAQLYFLLINYDIKDSDLVECEKIIDKAIDLLKKYEEEYEKLTEFPEQGLYKQINNILSNK